MSVSQRMFRPPTCGLRRTLAAETLTQRPPEPELSPEVQQAFELRMRKLNIIAERLGAERGAAQERVASSKVAEVRAISHLDHA
jgi:hypothetical protein